MTQRRKIREQRKYEKPEFKKTLQGLWLRHTMQFRILYEKCQVLDES